MATGEPVSNEKIMEADIKASKSVLSFLLDKLGMFGSFLFVCVAIMVGIEVVMRFVFKSPTQWTTEISALVTIAATFLIVGFTLKENAHTRVDFITEGISKSSNYLLDLFTICLSMLFTLVLTYYGIRMVQASYMMDEVSQVLQLPLWSVQAFLPLGSFLMFLQLLKLQGGNIRGLFTGILSTFPGGVKPRSFIPIATFVVALGLGCALLPSFRTIGVILLFFGLLFNGMPVSFALSLFGILGFYILLGEPTVMQVPMVAYASCDSIVILAFPLFLLTGTILEAGKMGPSIFNFAYTLVRHLPGGMGVAAIIFCGIFAAMTGSSVAVAAAVSVIALPEMLKRGYSKTTSIGLLAAGGTLGVAFPPSLGLIMYSALTFESLGDLFLSALIPGLILAALFCGYIIWVGMRDKNIQRDKRASLSEIWKVFRETAAGLMVIVIIAGGIYSGIFTPTEAGAVALLYSIFLTVVWYRTLTLKQLATCVLKGGRISSMIILIIIAANITGNFITMSQITQDALTAVTSMSLPTWLYTVFILIILIILGGPLEAVSIMVITVPILFPIIKALGLNGLWFGIIQIVTGELALISPPSGANLFILQEVGKASAAEISRGVVPFLILMCILLALICVFPQLTMWLPAVFK